jgi:hypothetical protein
MRQDDFFNIDPAKKPEPMKKISNLETFPYELRKPIKNDNMRKVRFKNFKLNKNDILSLEEYVDFLEEEGWGVMGTTELEDKIIIHCQWANN